MTEENKKMETEKYQISILKDRIVEYNKIDDSYLAREWDIHSDVKGLCKFLEDKKVTGFLESKISTVIQKGSNKLVQLVLVPKYAEPLEELIFNSREEVEGYIKENGLKPSSNIAPDEYKEQLSNFFEGKECFFSGAKDLRLKFEEEASESESESGSAEERQFNLQKKYEHIILDILYNI